MNRTVVATHTLLLNGGAVVYGRQSKNTLHCNRGILSSVRRTLRLVKAADINPNDAKAQAEFLSALNEVAPHTVVKRVEMGKFATNEDVKKEYLKALGKTGQLNQQNLKAVLGGTSATSSAMMDSGSGEYASRSSGYGNGGADRIDFADGLTPDRPLKLQLPKPTAKEEIFKTVKWLGLAFIGVTGMSWLFETVSSGVSGRMDNMNQEYTPANEKSKRFADVRGCPEAVAELNDIVQYLQNPSIYTDLGGKLPSGVLLTGPPGTGKTLLAKAVAGEAGVPFFYASGSEFEEVFVGVGAKRIRSLFAAAKEHAPCIVFIDEIDAVGGKRNPRDTQSSKMTLNQLLVEMDGFEDNSGIVVMGATNFPGLLDTALTRPGRFDQEVPVQLPDRRGRQDILELYLGAVKVVSKHIDSMINIIARGTAGFTGAELENLVNMASIRASVRGGDSVELKDLEFAREKILMGPEKKTFRLTEANKKCTAHHEAGHALVAVLTPEANPIYKATILPRGRALGMVMQLPTDDKYTVTKAEMLAHIDVCMGGRVAEELLLGKEDFSTGAVSDYSQATAAAKQLVEEYGMSKTVGPVSLKDREMSQKMKAMVDAEVASVLKDSHERVKKLILSRRAHHLALAEELLERETLTGDEIKRILSDEWVGSHKGKKSKKVTGRDDRATKKGGKGASDGSNGGGKGNAVEPQGVRGGAIVGRQADSD